MERTFSYEAFLSPLIIGAMALLPSVVLYSNRELSLKQTMLRRALHLLLLELTINGFGYVAGFFADPTMLLPNVLIVFSVYVFTVIFSWILDHRTVQEINRGLRRLQDK